MDLSKCLEERVVVTSSSGARQALRRLFVHLLPPAWREVEEQVNRELGPFEVPVLIDFYPMGAPMPWGEPRVGDFLREPPPTLWEPIGIEVKGVELQVCWGPATYPTFVGPNYRWGKFPLISADEAEKEGVEPRVPKIDLWYPGLLLRLESYFLLGREVALWIYSLPSYREVAEKIYTVLREAAHEAAEED